MKRLIKIKTLYIAALALGIVSFGSCLKDTGPIEDFSKSPALVSFQYTGSQAEPYNVSVYGTPQDSAVVEVTLSVASLTQGTPVTATIVPYQAGLDSFNTANGTGYEQLASSFYTLPNSGNVTIPAGQQIVTFTIHLAGDQINWDTLVGLSLQIQNASGALIASNLNTAILLIKLRNAYEANYNCTGYFVHPAAPRAILQTGTITTISLVTSQAPLADLGGWFFDFDTDPNSPYELSNWAAEGATYPQPSSGFMYVDNPTQDPNYPGAPFVSTTYNNTYDPANKIFWMHFGYANGSTDPSQYTREIYEEFARQ